MRLTLALLHNQFDKLKTTTVKTKYKRLSMRIVMKPLAKKVKQNYQQMVSMIFQSKIEKIAGKNLLKAINHFLIKQSGLAITKYKLI